MPLSDAPHRCPICCQPAVHDEYLRFLWRCIVEGYDPFPWCKAQQGKVTP